MLDTERRVVIFTNINIITGNNCILLLFMVTEESIPVSIKHHVPEKWTNKLSPFTGILIYF